MSAEQKIVWDRAPSKSGYIVSLAGLIGGTLDWDEGIELHVLGANTGVDSSDLPIKLPALGKLSLSAGPE